MTGGNWELEQDVLCIIVWAATSTVRQRLYRAWMCFPTLVLEIRRNFVNNHALAILPQKVHGAIAFEAEILESTGREAESIFKRNMVGELTAAGSNQFVRYLSRHEGT